MKIQALIACGSNLNDPEEQVCLAQTKLTQIKGVWILAVSGFYWTKPEGYSDQSDFFNGAFLIETDLTSEDLHSELLQIENEQGRARDVRNGPRTLDLDLIFFGDEIRCNNCLTLPHPKAHEREFVLRPMSEIAPDFIHPVMNKTLRELYRALS